VVPSVALRKEKRLLYFYLLFFFIKIPFNSIAAASSAIMLSQGAKRLKAFIDVEIPPTPDGDVFTTVTWATFDFAVAPVLSVTFM